MTYFYSQDSYTGTNANEVPANTQDAESVNWTLGSGHLAVTVTATLDGNGNVVFDYDANSAYIDLTGFYLDIDNDGGSYCAANWKDWMIGKDSDGDYLDGFDFAATVGSIWAWDSNNTGGSLTVSLDKLGIDSLSDLDGAELGFNSTYGSSPWCKTMLKLADTGTATYAETGGVDGEPVDGYVEMADSQIDSLILNFYVTGNPEAHPGDANGDWYYSVAVDLPASASEDPDAYLDELVALLVATDPNLDGTSQLKSVIVIEEDGDMNNYGTTIGTSSNGELPDELPWNVFNDFDHVLDDNTDLAGGIEASYDLTNSTDAFLFA